MHNKRRLFKLRTASAFVFINIFASIEKGNSPDRETPLIRELSAKQTEGLPSSQKKCPERTKELPFLLRTPPPYGITSAA